MSCIIENKKKEILECSAGLLEDLFHAFNEITREENLSSNNEFDQFLIKLKVAALTHGSIDIDIADIFHSSDNIDLLIKLLEKAIPRIQSGLREHAVVNLWRFRDELIKYREELAAQGK